MDGARDASGGATEGDRVVTPEQRARVEVFERWLSVPDPFDCWRRHRVTQPGDPDRDTATLHALLVRWAVRRRVELGLDRESASDLVM